MKVMFSAYKPRSISSPKPLSKDAKTNPVMKALTGLNNLLDGGGTSSLKAALQDAPKNKDGRPDIGGMPGIFS